MTTKSPSPAAPSLVSRLAERSRSASSSPWIASSGGRGLALADLDALVGPELRRRAHADLDGEREALARAREVAEVQVRVADGVDPGASMASRYQRPSWPRIVSS
jgi:hypothetical protein